MINWTTAGESHGPALLVTIVGMPSGVPLSSEKIKQCLAQRRQGIGRGSRQKFEEDKLEIISGIRHGKTLGSPISLIIHNSEWPKWKTVMAADEVDPEDLLLDAGTGDAREIARNKPLTKPRPGHADIVGMLKYNFDNARNVLERASARETAARVAAGACAKALLEYFNIHVLSHVISLGSVRLPESSALPTPADMDDINSSSTRCLDPQTSKAMEIEVISCQRQADTLGGVVEVLAYNVPPGIGTYVESYKRIDAQISQALMSIQAVKGVEIGDGFTTATRRGSQAHDEIFLSDKGDLERHTNRAGGIEGGMSNGEPIRARIAFKPISTVPRALKTVDLADGTPTTAIHQRSDISAVIPGAVVAEAEIAIVIARNLLEKTGGDSLLEVSRNLKGYLMQIQEQLP